MREIHIGSNYSGDTFDRGLSMSSPDNPVTEPPMKRSHVDPIARLSTELIRQMRCQGNQVENPVVEADSQPETPLLNPTEIATDLVKPGAIALP